MEMTVLRTPREKARYGSRTMIGGKPVMVVKTGKKMDYVTPEEIVAALYGRPVDHFVFKGQGRG